MQNEKSQRINKRFYEAFDILIATGQIKSLHSFCVENGIDRRNFVRLREEPQREFQLSLLSVLVSEYNVSAEWLLLGRGNIFA